eukprot:1069961-Prymnesium_polylepis.2
MLPPWPLRAITCGLHEHPRGRSRECPSRVCRATRPTDVPTRPQHPNVNPPVRTHEPEFKDHTAECSTFTGGGTEGQSSHVSAQAAYNIWLLRAASCDKRWGGGV